MARKTISVIVGLIAAFIVVFMVEMISNILYPPPAHLDLKNAEAMREYVQGLPATAFLIVLVAHGAGSFCGALVCCWLARETWYWGGLIIGALLMIAGIINVLEIPHPLWFAVIDLLIYIPSALLGCLIAGMGIASGSGPGTSSDAADS